MSSEVQNTGISGNTKRTHVLHLKKKRIACVRPYDVSTTKHVTPSPPPWDLITVGVKHMVTNIQWQKEAQSTCTNIDHWHSLSQPHIPPLRSKTSPVLDSVYTFPHSRSKGHARTVKVNGEGHCVQKVKDNQRLAERVYLFAGGKLKRWLEADFLLPTFCFRLSSGAFRISPRWGRQFSEGAVNTRFCQIFPKTAWNWKNLDPQGGCASLAPPLRSANAEEFFCVELSHVEVVRLNTPAKQSDDLRTSSCG